ncbi:alpha/beta fold hydrolase [Allostreptomyces psammosilenae]|uniref:alpha/beta fold hydrolase n=1 Tax=Allostreptomyces psammosilenae TaxID=1892865 RepID=UPI0035E402E2
MPSGSPATTATPRTAPPQASAERPPTADDGPAPVADPVRLDGPWTHRDVAANGARFHIAEMGEGPLVMLVHGFPQFWWAWRHQMSALAAAGYRAVAVDLRGVGGSDRTPRGYDPTTMALDVLGVIRSLGEPDAAVVGHSWGGYVGWTAAALRPKLVRRLAVLSMPHPRVFRHQLLTDPRQAAASRHILRFQSPWLPERRLSEDDCAEVARLITQWSGEADATAGRPDAQALRRYQDAFAIPATAHCSVEPYRWLIRSLFRPDGIQFNRRMARTLTMPVLQLHGAADRVVLPRGVSESARYVGAPYRWRTFDGVGHFPHEEVPGTVSAELVNWLAEEM